jgi:hypothetical protein
MAEALKAGERERGGVHILAFNRDGPDGRFWGQVAPYFRMVYADIQILTLFGKPEFGSRIHGYVDYEDAWRENVMPQALSAPLLLPEDHFRAPKAYSEMWERARRCSKDYEELTILQKTRLAFERDLHRRDGWKQGYIDTADRFFVYNDWRAQHGIGCPAIERWKADYKMPSGFHYDVQGYRESSGRNYINIFPHGRTRPGRR